MEDEPKDKRYVTHIDFSVGLGGLLDSLGSLLREATNLNDAAAAERSTGATVLGSSVRVAPRRVPGAPRFAGSRRQSRKEASVADAREPIVDVLDEGDHLLVVAEMPGADEAAVQWSIPSNLLLVIGAKSGSRKYYREIPLPVPVETAPAASSCRNGVLELKLWKQCAG